MICLANKFFPFCFFEVKAQRKLTAENDNEIDGVKLRLRFASQSDFYQGED